MKVCEWEKCEREATRVVAIVGVPRLAYECDLHADALVAVHQIESDERIPRLKNAEQAQP